MEWSFITGMGGWEIKVGGGVVIFFHQKRGGCNFFCCSEATCNQRALIGTQKASLNLKLIALTVKRGFWTEINFDEHQQ